MAGVSGQNILFLEYGKAWVVDVKAAQEDVTLLQGRDSRIACNCKNKTQNIDQPIDSSKERNLFRLIYSD